MELVDTPSLRVGAARRTRSSRVGATGKLVLADTSALSGVL